MKTLFPFLIALKNRYIYMYIYDILIVEKSNLEKKEKSNLENSADHPITVVKNQW